MNSYFPCDVSLLKCLKFKPQKKHVSELGRGHSKENGNRNFRELLSALVEQMLLNGAAQIEEMATQFLQFALHHSVSNMCSTQADKNSRKLRLPVSLVCPGPYCFP
jgi:hypothetical protein